MQSGYLPAGARAARPPAVPPPSKPGAPAGTRAARPPAGTGTASWAPPVHWEKWMRTVEGAGGGGWAEQGTWGAGMQRVAPLATRHAPLEPPAPPSQPACGSSLPAGEPPATRACFSTGFSALSSLRESIWAGKPMLASGPCFGGPWPGPGSITTWSGAGRGGGGSSGRGTGRAQHITGLHHWQYCRINPCLPGSAGQHFAAFSGKPVIGGWATPGGNTHLSQD